MKSDLQIADLRIHFSSQGQFKPMIKRFQNSIFSFSFEYKEKDLLIDDNFHLEYIPRPKIKEENFET